MVDTTGRIPEEFIQSLLARIDIVEVINASVPLRKAGTNYVACCPFHNEKTPSFSVNQNKQFYHCFGCGVSGDAIQFLIEHKALSFVEAVELLANQLGMQLPVFEKSGTSGDHNLIYTILETATSFFEQQLRQQNLARQAVQYLKQRGLTGITAKNFRLGFAPPGWDNLLTSIASDSANKELGVKAGLFINREANRYYDRFRNRIIFPIRNRRGKVVGFGGRVIDNNTDEPKYLNSPETPVFSKSHELYGFYEARPSILRLESVLVVEGYMDVVSLAQAGITNVVATLGTACTEQQIRYLFKTVAEVVFCFDGDSAGKKAAWRALELCLPLLDDKHRIKFLILGNGEDPDSFVQKHGAALFVAQIKQAISLPDYLFDVLSKQVNLEQIDGRVQFANQIKQHLAKLQDGILKTMLFDRLAQIINIDPTILRGKIAQSRHRYSEFSHTVIEQKSTKAKGLVLVSPAMRALALLIANRDLINHLPDLQGLQRLDIYGVDLLCAVAAILKQNPSATDSEISGSLPENMATNFRPMELRGLAHIVPLDGQKDELLGALAILKRREKELVTDHLLLKAKQNALTAAEKQLLQQMLLDK